MLAQEGIEGLLRDRRTRPSGNKSVAGGKVAKSRGSLKSRWKMRVVTSNDERSQIQVLDLASHPNLERVIAARERECQTLKLFDPVSRMTISNVEA